MCTHSGSETGYIHSAAAARTIRIWVGSGSLDVGCIQSFRDVSELSMHFFKREELKIRRCRLRENKSETKAHNRVSGLGKEGSISARAESFPQL